MSVRKAVIPAAGLGTRFLPATKAQPKEMIPVVDTPGIQYVVEEAVRAGISDIVIVTSRGKQTMEDHFDRAFELERYLESKEKIEELEEIRRIAELAEIHYVRQREPLGFGHAVACARHHVGDEPFAVLVGDELVPEPRGEEVPLLPELMAAYDRYGASVVAVQEVPKEDVSAYGIIDGEPVENNVQRLRDMIEKPPTEEAPSQLASRGRYVFAPEIFDVLDRTEPGVGGEIQLTDAISLLAKEASVYAYVYEGPIFDVGKKLDYLKTTIELTLRRDDLAKPFKEWLAERATDLD
ncbi:MAG: UTP--glucose-1-phosphate uridylyltransferase GalU [Actinomycetota bacterium]